MSVSQRSTNCPIRVLPLLPIVLLAWFLTPASLWPQAGVTGLSETQRVLVDEHVYGGLPSHAPILVHNGYVALYSHEHRVPLWVAYHIVPEYRQTPPREGPFETFRPDPDVSNPVVTQDYTGLFSSRGYARGHLAPYAVMGGDRDDDGLLAQQDPDDAETVFQGNYMSNIAPQHHQGFNGSGGLWFELERWIQDSLVVGQGKEVWVQAGSVFGPGRNEQVGPNQDIHVPPMFYKIVVFEEPNQADPVILAFLFPHQRLSHGEIQDFLVSIDVLESLTGLDFFNELDDAEEDLLEDRDTWETWESLSD